MNKPLNLRATKLQYAAWIITAILCNQLVYSQNDELSKYVIPIHEIGIKSGNLRLDGFYYTKEVKVRNGDTLRFIAPLILFENGTAREWDYIGDGQRNRTVKVKGKKCSLPSSGNKSFKPILEFTECFLHTLDYKTVRNIYSINERFFKMQDIWQNTLYQRTGIIVNDTTFVITSSSNSKTKKSYDINEVYHFYNATKPKSSRMKPKKFYKKISPE